MPVATPAFPRLCPSPAHAGPERRPTAQVVLRPDGDEPLALDLARWNRPATAEEQRVLAAVAGPVIDLGCGPGRLVFDLAARRVRALGIDSSPDAVGLARRRGATVLQRDLFDRLPGEGRWATALLFDGNVGIGGDPVRLLDRCRRLLTPPGRIVVEVDPPGTGWRRLSACLERGRRRSAPFPWAVVGADAIASLAEPAGLSLATMTLTSSGRRFAQLERVA